VKKTPLFVAAVVGLTVVFYLVAYFFLPPPPPSVALVGLFAAIAMAVVWAAVAGYRKFRASRKHVILLCVLLGLGVCQVGCKRQAASHADGAPATGAPPPSSTAPPPPPPPAPPPPSPTAPPSNAAAPPPPNAVAPPSPVSRPELPATSAAPLPRVTGTAFLLSSQKEKPGYGLYSYALLTHRADDSELPRYKAFLQALLALPTAAQEAEHTPVNRINITYLLLDSLSPAWANMTLDQQVNYILAHYDYGWAAVMETSLSTKVGPGPVIVSVLQPVDPTQHPHPVLVQDLSLAQPDLMTTYVSYFVQQAGKDQFWQQSTMSELALSLRNGLETAAVGLSMSKSAVQGWVKFFS
jgi:hypothetical protein